MPILFHCLLFLLTSAWQSPQHYSARQRFADSAAQLDYLVLEINGARRLVYNQQQLELVVGDSLRVISAILQVRSRRAGYVNVVGFRNPPDNGKDRDYLINTGTDLLPAFSFANAGNRYAISVGSERKVHGEVFVQLLQPVLRFVVLAVNEHPEVLRNGQVMQIGMDDRLQVKKISTNLNNTEGLRFNIYRTKKAHEVRFEYRDKVFASIPLQVVDK